MIGIAIGKVLITKIVINEEDDKGDIETESNCSKTSAYISEENDELTDEDKEFEESEMPSISDGTVYTMLVDCNFDKIIHIFLIYFFYLF